MKKYLYFWHCRSIASKVFTYGQLAYPLKWQRRKLQILKSCHVALLLLFGKAVQVGTYYTIPHPLNHYKSKCPRRGRRLCIAFNSQIMCIYIWDARGHIFPLKLPYFSCMHAFKTFLSFPILRVCVPHPHSSLIYKILCLNNLSS